MSQENEEIVKQAFATWNAGDMEHMRTLYDRDVVVRSPPDWPEPGPFVGREAVFHQFDRMRETFDRDRFDMLTEPISAGDRVVLRVAWRGSGRGPDSNLEMTLSYTIRDRLILGIDFFGDHAEALEAAGLMD